MQNLFGSRNLANKQVSAFLGVVFINLHQILSWIHHTQSDAEEFCSCSAPVICPDWFKEDSPERTFLVS